MKAYAQQAPGGAAQPLLNEGEISSLVENYLPLVVKQAARVWLSPRIGLTRDDLISAGCYGLLLAAQRFDPSRGIGFGVFARSHVHGAMMREINSASRAAGVGADETFPTPVTDVEPDSLPDERGEEEAQDTVETARVRELMEYFLSESERTQLTLYYYEELTLAEIAAVVGHSARAVTRTLKGALAKLKAAMAEQETP